MELTRTRELLPTVIWRESSPSTNAELRQLAAADPALPHGTLLATADQTAGRGRLDRGWITPPDSAIAASLLLRPTGRGDLPVSWLPLIAGSAVTTALQPLFRPGAAASADATAGHETSGASAEAKRVGVKWPNDVHVRDEDDAIAGRPGRKLCGILCELLPDGSVIVGTGFNLLIPEWELPTERATSLLAAGADVSAEGLGEARSLADAAGRDLADRVLAAYAAEMLRLVDLGGRDRGAVQARAARHSLTLGTEVRVHLPGDEVVDGRARELADDGSLVVDLPTGGRLTVSAGDVEHLR
ncbi:MAG: biotin--[acetyl-CoA-carboxylase] ligase [Leucobacter sp.]